MRDVARSRAESPRRTHTVVLAGWLAVAFVLAGCQVGGGTPDAGAPGGSDGSGDFDAGMDGAADGRAGPDAGHLDARDERDGRSGPSDVGTGWDFGTVDSSDGTAPFELDAIVPPSGPVDGGNRVRVVGQGLTAQVDLFIGGRRADVTRSGGELVARVPAAESPHRATVKVVGPDGRRRSLKDGYEYVSAIRVERVTPTRIPTDGGVQVEVRGQGFGPSVGVSVDRQSAWRVDRIDSGLLRFVAPPGSAGPADLRLTTRHESAVVEDALEYVAPLSIDGLAPAAGSTAGGDRVVVEGGGFGPRARVTFGGERATVLQREKGGKKLVVRTPAHPAGTVDIGVQSGGDAVLAADAFVYQSSSQPTVASLSPGSGPASGGTKVRIVGRGFDRKNLQVAFGGKSASVVEKKPTFLRVETPAASPGTVDVVVRAAGSKIGELTDGFRYVEDLFVDSVSPDAGPAAGGTDVTIRGTGFQGVDEVTFGGLPASFDVRSNSKLRATTPAHAAGKVDVVLHRGETTARHRDAFTYRTDVEIWGFSPVRGAIAGGTYVEVRGKGFIGRVSAELDGSSVNGIRRIDRNNLFFYTPSHPTGTAELTVQSEVGKAKGPYPFRYFNPASRKGGASGGPVRGAVNVTVLAQGGGPIEGAFVMLSTRRDTPHSGTTDANGQVTLSGPGVQGAQTVTATAKGFTSTTVRDIDSENLTLFLRSKSPSNGGGGGGGGDPPMATIEGTVRAPVKFGNPDDKVSWEMAVVRTTMESIGGRRIEPGPN
ncbi:MAG: IPT/TIG domain-containing protein [Bradymonadaceae bacterium]